MAEILLWNGLKNKQMKGYDFHRQKPLFKYIADFFCNELLLAVEIDGASHDYRADDDIIRQQELEEFGIRFLRFHDMDVKRDVNGVLRVIEEWIEEYEKEHTPNPSQEGNVGGHTPNLPIIHRVRLSREGDYNKHTPNPSQEGDDGEHTPNPSQEGDDGEHTPNPSQEGDDGEHTPNPSQEGNVGGHTPNPSQEGNSTI